jgi:hypothetical protein
MKKRKKEKDEKKKNAHSVEIFQGDIFARYSFVSYQRKWLKINS